MQTIATLAWLNLVQLVRDRSGLATMLVTPLILTSVFGAVLGGGERRAVVVIADRDGSAYSAEVLGGLDERSYERRYASEAEARAMVSAGQASLGVIVPAGFGDDVLGGVDTAVTLVEDPRSSSRLAVAESLRGRVERLAADAQTIRIVRAAFREAGAGLAARAPAPADIYTYADEQWRPEPPVSVSEERVTVSEVRGASQGAMGFQQFSLGFTIMFMMFMGFNSAGGFLEEREQGTLARLLVTPASRPVLIAGKVVGIYVTVLLEAAIMIGAGAFVYRVPWGDDPLGVVMIVGAFALAATGLGVMASTLARTRGQLSAASAVTATALAMLGGCYWPLDIVNETMRTVAKLTPTGWAMMGLVDVVVRNQGPAQALLPSLVLLGMATLFMAVGLWRLRLE